MEDSVIINALKEQGNAPNHKLPEKPRLILLILLEVALLLIPILSLPEVYQSGRDAIFESQYASLIIREQRWDPSLGTGMAENYYGHNPILHFVFSIRWYCG